MTYRAAFAAKNFNSKLLNDSFHLYSKGTWFAGDAGRDQNYVDMMGANGCRLGSC